MISGISIHAVVGVAGLVAGVGLGSVAATWRANANCAENALALTSKITTLSTEKQQLELAIVEQNKGVEVAKAQTDAAKAAQAQAQRHAADLASFSQARLDRLATAVTKASTCGDVLKGYWEVRK